MIIDNMKYGHLYGGVHAGIGEAFRFLQSNDAASMSPGKYEIDGTRLYVMIQHYETKSIESGVWEGHRLYWDLQLVLSGRERIGYAPRERMSEIQAYREGEDYALFAGEGTFCELRAGDFMILAPQDIHMPCISVQQPEPVIKAVFKLLA